MDVSLHRDDLNEEGEKLDWYVMESTSELIKIQILFDPEDLISNEPMVQKLKVIFWGTEFFKSA